MTISSTTTTTAFQHPSSSSKVHTNIRPSSTLPWMAHEENVKQKSSALKDISSHVTLQLSDSTYTAASTTTDSGEGFLTHYLIPSESDDKDDVWWSAFSNTFFLGGGLCYVIGSCWDWYLGDTEPLVLDHVYRAIWVAGPFVYLLNSFIDVAWSLDRRKVEKKRRGLKRFYNEVHEHAANVSNTDGDSSDDIQLAFEKMDQHATILGNDLLKGAITAGKQQQKQSKKNNIERHRKVFLRRLRRHFGHRRELSSASAFGAAAIFGLWSAIGSNSGQMGEVLVDQLDAISIHLYLLSAIFALYGRTPPPPASQKQKNFFDNTDALENLGDTLFGVASVVDVILCDFSFDDSIYWWPVVSASLWLLDALFYLRGDFVAIYSQRPQQRDEDPKRTSMIMIDGEELVTNYEMIEIV